MPLYEATLQQMYFGQECINRFNFDCPTVPAGSSGSYLLAVAMGAIADDDTPAFDATTILGLLQPLQVVVTEFSQLVIRNLYSVTDFYTYAFPVGTVGTGGGEGLSPVSALGFTSNRTVANIRRSQKRFVGLAESVTTNGGYLSDAFATQAQLLGTAMGNPNTATVDGVTTVFNPIVCSREKYHPPGKTTWAYKYWPDEATQRLHIAPVTQYDVKRTVRSQTSRQYGRGV